MNVAIKELAAFLPRILASPYCCLLTGGHARSRHAHAIKHPRGSRCATIGLFMLCSMAHAQTPVRFIENKNQWPANFDLVSRIPGGQMAISAGTFQYFFLDGAKLDALHHGSHAPDAWSAGDDDVRGHAVFVEFAGADPDITPEPFGQLPEYFNYYLGSDPARWASRVRAYKGVLYNNLYEGIDLKVYASGENVKYDLVVAPGGDPDAIRMVYQGAEEIALNSGDLQIKTPLTNVIEKKPVAWQWIDGKKVYVMSSFKLDGNVVSFAFPNGFDACYELIIDPLLIFSTFSGSTADNWGSTATPGEHGNLYSAGVTEQISGGVFPATPGAYQTTTGGLYDIGILKYDSLGTNLLYATYLGGSNSESPHSLVMNAQEELILLGTTSSSDFPTTESAYDRSFNGGTAAAHVIGYSAGSDIVISRFSPDGTALLASTFFGGDANDGLNPTHGMLARNYGDQLRGDIITDAAGNVYISSVTASADLFEVPSGFQPAYQGGETDALLLKMDLTLSQVILGSYIGGSAADASHSIKLASDGSIYLAGGTASNNFPATPDSYQTAFAGEVDGWIARLSSNGLAILQATYTGTTLYNQIYFLDLNENEEVYVYGQTVGDFPITPGVYSNPGSGQFVQKFSQDLRTLIFSTVFGSGRGIPDISPTAFLVNDCNNLYMSGWGGRINTATGHWPNANSSTLGLTTTPDAFQSTTSGSDFYFIVLTDDATERLYATFLGGSQSRTHVDGGTSRFDKGGIVYHSVCSGCRAENATDPDEPTSDFPTTPGAWSRQNRSWNCNNAAFKFDLSSLKARLRTNSADRTMPGMKVVCLPDPIGFENHSTGGEVFEWDFGDGGTFSTPDTAFVIHQYDNPGAYHVTLKAIDPGTCQVVDVTSVLVTVNTPASWVQDDADLCFNDAYRLQAGGGVTYTWTSTDPAFSSQEANPVVAPADTTTYYVRLEEANGCVRRDTVTLNVVPGITPEFEWQKLPACEGRPEIFVRIAADSLKAGDSFFFDFGDGLLSDHEESQHYFEEDGVYNVRLVTQREFCVYEKAIAIPVFDLFIPNVITPGRPDHNDVFTIRYGQAEGATPGDYGFNVSLVIFNRWGREVFRTDSYQYDWSGEDLAAGTYYYELTIDGHATCKSWLQVVK